MNNIEIIGKECCGCRACEQICPVECIVFKENEEGFLYPIVNEEKCINCGRCVLHCPIIQLPKSSSDQVVYAAKCRDQDTARKSTSGGIFVPLAKKVLAENGIVFGCAYDEQLTARHIAVENEAELYKLQGSKYVQSDLSEIYSCIKKELQKDRTVLFSGTGCQAAGLRSFLGKEYANLILIDIVCHGVPSPKLFAKYIDHLSKKIGEPIKSYHFRSKERYGWGCFYRLETSSVKKSGNGFDDPYYRAFLQGKTYRESCYRCPFANKNRMGDITLGDFWGIESMIPSFYSENGVSLVILNTEKGKRFWNSLNDEFEVMEASMEQAVKMNKNLSEPSIRPECRDTIYQGIDGDFEYYMKKNLPVKYDLKRKLKSLIPVSFKGKIKYMLKR